MKKREQISDPNSCWNKARDDEEVFILLERDLAAPPTVLNWREHRVRLGLNNRNDAKLVSAKDWADRVDKLLKQREPEPGSLWRHTKSGDKYQVLMVVTIETNLSKMVVYQQYIPTTLADNTRWARPLSEFLGDYMNRVGEMVPRFVPVKP